MYTALTVRKLGHALAQSRGEYCTRQMDACKGLKSLPSAAPLWLLPQNDGDCLDLTAQILQHHSHCFLEKPPPGPVCQNRYREGGLGRDLQH